MGGPLDRELVRYDPFLKVCHEPFLGYVSCVGGGGGGSTISLEPKALHATWVISKNPDQLAEVSAEFPAEVSASFAEVSASFAEICTKFRINFFET